MTIRDIFYLCNNVKESWNFNVFNAAWESGLYNGFYSDMPKSYKGIKVVGFILNEKKKTVYVFIDEWEVK